MNAKTILGMIAFPIFCLLLSFYALYTDPAFTYLLLKNKEAIEPTKQLLNDFNEQNDIPTIFNETERAHLLDVRRIIHGAIYLLEFLAIALIFCSVGNWRKVIIFGSGLLAIMLIIGFLIPFETLFTYFHLTLFPQGNWMFPPDSILVQFYPATFFANYGLAIALNSLVAACILLIVSRKG